MEFANNDMGTGIKESNIMIGRSKIIIISWLRIIKSPFILL